METIHTIATPDLTAKLNKAEIDIIHFIDSWLPTLTDWSVDELSHKCRLFTTDAHAAVDMLILHGLLDKKKASQRLVRPVICFAELTESRRYT